VTDGQTDRQTDRIPIANTRSEQYMPVPPWRVKKRYQNIFTCFDVLTLTEW